jgi:hypothetical protein
LHLTKQGFDAKIKNGIILIGNSIAVADNIESDYGCNMNVIGSLDVNSFETIQQIGKQIRQVVEVGRVIIMGGVKINKESFFSCLEIKKTKGKIIYGINVPRLNIYNKSYQLYILGMELTKQNKHLYCF